MAKFFFLIFWTKTKLKSITMPEKKKQANNKNKKKINILTYCHLKVNKFVNRPENFFYGVKVVLGLSFIPQVKYLFFWLKQPAIQYLLVKLNVGSVVFFADSTVLAYVLKKLNQEYDYGLKLILLSVDEGITGYRDDSLEVSTHQINDLYVKR